MISQAFKNKLDKALKDEVKAAAFYTKMINSTNNINLRHAINEIRNDELDHHKKLSNIKRILQ